MDRIAMKLAMAATGGSLLFFSSTVAQVPPPAPKAAQVRILQGPELESTHGDVAIITWTVNNPGGMDGHVGIVKYGTSADNLSQIASSPIRLNRSHPDTVFRVYMRGLNPGTTYYYSVTSTEADGASDGVVSPVSQFTSAAGGK